MTVSAFGSHSWGAPTAGWHGDVEERQIDGVDMALVCLFLIGIYTNYTLMLSARVPFPSLPAGVAGMVLLWRRRRHIASSHVIGFFGVLLLYLMSVLLADNVIYLSRRLNGLIQLTYSIVIGYGLFLTIVLASRRQAAGLFLGACLFILVGCLLESYGGLQPVSDAVRLAIYDVERGIYDNDLRDTIYYGRPRPKFFASEPASVTFCFALFGFLWLVISTWRWKFPAYVALVALGMVAIPGPTLLLMLLLVLPYGLFLASRRGGRLVGSRVMKATVAAALCLAVMVVLAHTLLSERLEEAVSGRDMSFFLRVRGPAMAGLDVATAFPLAGAGLTGEAVVADRLVNLYSRSPAYSGWLHGPASGLVVNYFWQHWLYLGLVFGGAVATAVALWLRQLGAASPTFCLIAWAILGQASGAYVGPSCWAVLFLLAAATMQHQGVTLRLPAPAHAPTLGDQLVRRRLERLKERPPAEAKPVLTLVRRSPAPAPTSTPTPQWTPGTVVMPDLSPVPVQTPAPASPPAAQDPEQTSASLPDRQPPETPIEEPVRLEPVAAANQPELKEPLPLEDPAQARDNPQRQRAKWRREKQRRRRKLRAGNAKAHRRRRHRRRPTKQV